MKLAVEIPNNYDLSQIKNGSIACKIILNAVKNGTPRPEEHDDLISKQTVKDFIKELETEILGTMGAFENERIDAKYPDETARAQYIIAGLSKAYELMTKRFNDLFTILDRTALTIDRSNDYKTKKGLNNFLKKYGVVLESEETKNEM